jgi:hypothetical protein
MPRDGLLRCARNDGGVGGTTERYLRTLKKSFSSVAASVSPTAE